MVVEEIQANLLSENRMARLGGISLINLRLMRNPSRTDTLLTYLEDHIEAETDHEVLSFLHSVIADWKSLRVAVISDVFPEKEETSEPRGLMESQAPGFLPGKKLSHY